MATMLMATVALSIDVMLPALGAIAQEFAVEHGNQRQWIIVTVFIGLALGQLLFGPLSDAIGRRPAIVLGAMLFAAGGIVRATAPSFEFLIAGRLLQGFGAAGPRIVTVALISDRFAGADMARIMSIIMGIFILAPVLAPTVGQLLLMVMPWRGLFVVLSSICLIGTVWLLLRQPETHENRSNSVFKALARSILEVIRDQHAMRYTLASGLCYGALMGYIMSSQQIFQNAYGVGEFYAVLFGGTALFISVATQLNVRLVRHYPLERICITAVQWLTLWSLPFALLLTLVGGLPPLWIFMVFICPAVFLLGLTFGNFNAIALERLGHIAGLAAALTASVTTLLGALVAGIIGFSFEMTLYPINTGLGVCAALSWALMHSSTGSRPVR